MEELKQLIELVLKLPATALWILAGYLFYKLSVIASIYGIIRLAIDRTYSVLHARIVEAKKPVITLYKWKDGVEPLNEEVKERIISSLIRLKIHAQHGGLTYVHDDYAGVLNKIVNDYISQLPAKK